MVLAAIFLIALVGLASPAAALTERDEEEERAIEAELAATAQEAAPLFRAATEAMDRGDNAAAEKGFRDVLALVPNSDAVLRRLSYVTENQEEAEKLARRALEIRDHVYNKSALLGALSAIKRDAAKAEGRELARTLLAESPDDESTQYTVAEFAISDNNVPMLKEAVGNMRRLAPEEVGTHYFAAILALANEEWKTAEREMLAARDLGMPDEVVQGFLEEAGINKHLRHQRYLAYAGIAALAWAAGLVLLLLLGMILSRLTLSAIGRQGPEATGEPTGGMSTMRRAYGIVIALTTVYYYLSIPVVIILVLGAGGGAIYSFFALGRIPIKLVAIIGVGVLVTVWAMIRSLFFRPSDEDPGMELEKSQAPKLFATLDRVARGIGTRTVDKVYLTLDAGVAVFERGGTWKKMRGDTERCLILGLGAIEGMKQSQLEAILAHEFGHFSNKDTAGGSLALHVRRSILLSARAMAEGGAARWYNPAWLFLNAFYRIYLRASHGASRLQEVLADRWAATLAGSKAFAEGLTHVIRRSVEMDLVVTDEINRAVAEKRPLRNVYKLAVPTSLHGVKPEQDTRTPAEMIEDAVRERMEHPGTPFDSHPPAKMRIEWVEKLARKGAGRVDDPLSEKLFVDIGLLQQQMTQDLDQRVRREN